MTRGGPRDGPANQPDQTDQPTDADDPGTPACAGATRSCRPSCSCSANVLLVSVINFTVWFAITFFVYLETRSVFATGMIAGIFLVATMLTGIWFGSLVDHHSKKAVMQGSALASLVLYAGVVRALPGHAARGVPRPDEHPAVGLRRAADDRR